jgi:hypothetical protein
VSRRDQTWPFLITGLAAASTCFVLLDLPNPPRAAVVLAFVVVCPGMALVRLLRLGDALTELFLAVVVSLALAALVASIYLYLGMWRPRLSLLVIVAVALAAVLADLLRTDQPPA